eukprot:CAMPEP_0198202908 /NCGR_PEP_ID=MMETSP1445-20131203/6133_1 /TAXON_ID=36898 /ORGANISM="Pyramimonas sp., Strain CCMP2087" /LENGTH=544 /DNA_ID=CAMNT_0043874053 /DNA_START=417 /DNA_END=2048 /DNA_ORIENTATION=-
MGCSVSKSTCAEGIRHAHTVTCNRTLRQHLEKPPAVSSTANSFEDDSANNYNKNDLRAQGLFTSQGSDVLTDESSPDPYETCDTQTDDDDDDESTEEEEILTPTQMREETFVADRAASNMQRSAARSAERSAAQMKQTVEMTEEQAEAKMTRVKARASRRRARIEQRKAELKASQAYVKESIMQLASLRDDYENLARLDKIKHTKKQERRYNLVRQASTLNKSNFDRLKRKEDDAARKHAKEHTQKSEANAGLEPLLVATAKDGKSNETLPSHAVDQSQTTRPAVDQSQATSPRVSQIQADDVMSTTMDRLNRDLNRRATKAATQRRISDACCYEGCTTPAETDANSSQEYPDVSVGSRRSRAACTFADMQSMSKSELRIARTSASSWHQYVVQWDNEAAGEQNGADPGLNEGSNRGVRISSSNSVQRLLSLGIEGSGSDQGARISSRSILGLPESSSKCRHTSLPPQSSPLDAFPCRLLNVLSNEMCSRPALDEADASEMLNQSLRRRTQGLHQHVTSETSPLGPACKTSMKAMVGELKDLSH